MGWVHQENRGSRAESIFMLSQHNMSEHFLDILVAILYNLESMADQAAIEGTQPLP